MSFDGRTLPLLTVTGKRHILRDGILVLPSVQPHKGLVGFSVI